MDATPEEIEEGIKPRTNRNRNKLYHSKVNTKFINNNNNKKRFLNSLNKRADDIIHSEKYITNLSTKDLNDTEKRVLAKGLTFVPSAKYNETSTIQAFSRFRRSNRLRYFFRNSVSQKPHPFRQKSNWQPPKASPAIESYLERVEEGINNLPTKEFHYNLSKLEAQTLKKLASDPNLVIKNADKGSGIVIEDTHNYIQDGLDHLSDQTIYREINSDPTEPLAKGINDYVTYMHNKGIIDNVTRDYLIFPTERMPRTQQLYFLKKIHKNPIAVRPIVSGCGGPTEKISQLIDLHLQPFVPKIKSYIKDSGHLIKLLEETRIPTNCTLATIDVKALYLNIPHKDGKQAVRNRLYYQNEESDQLPIPQGTMADLLDIVLTQNYFQFADSMYQQVQGTAMGTKMAPAYANLFMADLEEKILANSPIDPILWKRYIDDVLCIWPGSQEQLQDFIKYLNRAHPTIKFTYESSTTSIDFLDITIYKGKRYTTKGILDIKPYFKKTNKFQYLEYSSAHPRNTFKGLVKGELTRLLRACSNQEEYHKIQLKMHKIFRDRGYPAQLIKSVQEMVPYSKRQEILHKPESPPCPYETFLVTQYTPDLDVTKLHSIIKPTKEEEDHVPKPCLSLQKTRNLSSIIVRAKLEQAEDPPKSDQPITIPITPDLNGQSAGCAIPFCKCCRKMSRKVRVTSSSNYKSFSTPKHTNCNTRCVIYLLECKKCSKGNQYVGQTQRPLAYRLASHRAASKIKINLPLYKHFAGKPDHDFERDTRLTILEKTTTDNLTNREGHWIKTLDTVYPKGLNSRYE